MSIVLKNNASNFLAAGIDSTQTTITLQSAASFPALSAGEYFYGTLEDTAGQVEIVKVTARVGDTLTVVRAQEGTSAASFAQGSRFELRVTVDSIEGGTYTTAAPTSVARTLQTKIREQVSVKDFGAVGDGVTDDTDAFREAVSSSLGVVYVPPGTYLINASSISSGVIMKSNVYLVGAGQEATILKALSFNSANYRLLEFNNVENCGVSNLTIVGDRDTNTATGEQGHGINITTTGKNYNIRVENVTSKDNFGDGIRIGRRADKIFVSNCVFDNNRRQGMSLTGGENIYVENCQFTNTNGTAPQMGVDIEPNNTDAGLKNVVFHSCYAANNVSFGFGVFQVSNMDEPVDILFSNCVVAGDSGENRFLVKNSDSDGVVRFENCIAYQPQKYGFEFNDIDLKITANNCIVLNPNQSDSSGGENGTGILFLTTASGKVKDVALNNMQVLVSDPTDFLALSAVRFDNTGGGVFENVDADIVTNIPSTDALSIVGNTVGVNLNLSYFKNWVRSSGFITADAKVGVKTLTPFFDLEVNGSIGSNYYERIIAQDVWVDIFDVPLKSTWSVTAIYDRDDTDSSVSGSSMAQAFVTRGRNGNAVITPVVKAFEDSRRELDLRISSNAVQVLRFDNGGGLRRVSINVTRLY